MSINPGVRKAEQQSKNQCKKKLVIIIIKKIIAHPLPHRTAKRDQPQHYGMMFCSHTETIASHEIPLSALKRGPRVKTPPCALREHERARRSPLREHSSSLSCITSSSLHRIVLLFETRGQKVFYATTVPSGKPGELPASPAWRALVFPGAGAWGRCLPRSLDAVFDCLPGGGPHSLQAARLQEDTPGASRACLGWHSPHQPLRFQINTA